MTTTETIRQNLSDTFPTMEELDTEIARVQSLNPRTPGGIRAHNRRLDHLNDIRNHRIRNS